MDREHARHAAEHGILREARLEVDRREARLPVVRVNDVGREAHAARAFERRAREQREPPRIVRMIARAVRAIDAVAIEQRRLVDQPRARMRPERLFVDLDRVAILPELHDARVDRLARHRDAAIARQHDGHVMTEPPERAGSAPATSASPPVFANGTASDVTINTVSGRSVSRSLRITHHQE